MSHKQGTFLRCCYLVRFGSNCLLKKCQPDKAGPHCTLHFPRRFVLPVALFCYKYRWFDVFVICRSEAVVCYRSSCNHYDCGAHPVFRNLNQTLFQFGLSHARILLSLKRKTPICPRSLLFFFVRKRSAIFIFLPCLLFLSITQMFISDSRCYFDCLGFDSRRC